MASSASRITQYGVARSIHTKVRLEASQFARPDAPARQDSLSQSGDNTRRSERCTYSPQAMASLRTWQPSNGILFAAGHADQETVKVARSFSSMPERQAPRDLLADWQPPLARPEDAQRHSEVRKLKRDLEMREVEIAQLRAQISQIESNVSKSDAFKRQQDAQKQEMRQQELRYKAEMKRQQDGHTEEMKRQRDEYAKEMQRKQLDAAQRLNDTQDQLNTLHRDLDSRVADKVGSERAAIRLKESAVIRERTQLEQKEEQLTAAELSLQSSKSEFKKYESMLEPLLVKAYENEVVVARASSMERQKQRDTYTRLKEKLHRDPQLASAQVLTAIEDEIKQAKEILKLMKEPSALIEHREQMESYIDYLKKVRSQLREARSMHHGRLHNDRRTLRLALYPDDGHPMTVLISSDWIVQQEYDQIYKNLSFAGIDDRSILFYFKQVSQFTHRLSNYRRQALLLNEPSEYQVRYRDHPKLRSLQSCAASQEAQGFYADNYQRLVQIAEDYKRLLRREAELIILRKEIGTWTEEEADVLRRESQELLERERRGVADCAKLLKPSRKSASKPASRIERSVIRSTKVRLSGAVTKASDRKRLTSRRRVSAVAPAATRTVKRTEALRKRNRPSIRVRRGRKKMTKDQAPQYHEVPSSNQPDVLPEARSSVDATYNYAPAVAQSSATAMKATLLKDTVTYSPGAGRDSTTALQRQTRWYSTAHQIPMTAFDDARYTHISQNKLNNLPVMDSEMCSQSHRSDHTNHNRERDDDDWEDVSDRSGSLTTSVSPEELRRRASGTVASAEAVDELDLSDLRLSTSSSDSTGFDDGSDDSSGLEDEQNLPALTYHIPPQKMDDAQAADPESSSATWSFRLYENADGEAVALHYYTNFDKAESAAAALLTEPVLGFDLEWEEYSKPGEHDKKRCISLLQLANEKGCHLFHIALLKGSTTAELIPPSLQKLLTSPNIAKAGVNVAGDAGRVRKTFGIEMQGVFELSHLYKLVTYGQDEPGKVNKRLVSLAQQVQQQLLLPLPKGEVRTSRWSNKLDLAQSEYAASDAYAGFRLFHALDEKRRAQKPAPPRPAFWELQLPIELADGSFARSKLQPQKVVSTTHEGDNDEKVANTNQGDENDEFYDALEYQDDDDSEAEPTKDERVRLLDLANVWIENWMATRPRGSRSGLTAAPLRAYHLWHAQGFDLDRTAAIYRQPPILPTTVASYVAEAISRGHLVYDSERLRAALQTLPKSVHGRYKGLIKKLNVGDKD